VPVWSLDRVVAPWHRTHAMPPCPRANREAGSVELHKVWNRWRLDACWVASCTSDRRRAMMLMLVGVFTGVMVGGNYALNCRGRNPGSI
jgi:hypothetical protein